MFKGFNLKYPEYEVITPQTKLSFTVRSLNVQEEERLKGSLLTPQKITEHLNKWLYESLVTKPEVIKDFKTFLENVTLKDRDALLYGLYHITYEEIRNYDIKCGNCRKDYPVTVKASSTFNANPYPEEDDIRKKKILINLPVSKGVKAYLKQPVLLDEVEAIKNLSAAPGLTIDNIVETLIIDRFEQDVEAAVEPVVWTDRNDIIDAYRSLPAKDKRSIYEKYNEEFGKYNIELKMKTFCIHCGNEETINIDLVENFFRMVYSS